MKSLDKVRKYRKVRPVFTYMIVTVGTLLAIYGALWHRYQKGMVFYILGCALFFLGLHLMDKKFEVKR